MHNTKQERQLTSPAENLMPTRDITTCSGVPRGQQVLRIATRFPEKLLVKLRLLNLSLLAAEILGTGAIGFLGDKSSGHIMVEHNIQFQNTDQVVAEVV